MTEFEIFTWINPTLITEGEQGGVNFLEILHGRVPVDNPQSYACELTEKNKKQKTNKKKKKQAPSRHTYILKLS